MPCAFRPLDEVGDDQEVAGILHPLDDAELEGEPLAIVLGGAAGREPVRGKPPFEAGFGLRGAMLLRLVAPRASPSLGRKARQDRRQRARPEGAALRDLDGRGERLRQIGEQRRHLGAGLETVLRRELAAVAVGDRAALGDAEQRVMGLVILARGEERLVGGDQRDAARIGEIDQRGSTVRSARHAVALQLDIEPVAEQALQVVAARQRQRVLAGGDGGVERATGAAGERDQSVGLAVEPGELDVRALVRRRFRERRASDSRIRLR